MAYRSHLSRDCAARRFLSDLNGGNLFSLQEAAQVALDGNQGDHIETFAVRLHQCALAVKAEAVQQGKNLKWINKHPIMILFADRLWELTDSPSWQETQWAREECARIAKENRKEIRTS